MIIPKGQLPKLKGAICNIVIDTSDITSALPHSADSTGLIMVKSKCKLGFWSHLCFNLLSAECLFGFLTQLCKALIVKILLKIWAHYPMI